ncbi:hypothetical protein [Streptomyces sp. NPDC051098]
MRVVVRFDESGWTMTYARHYWWDTETITEDHSEPETRGRA